MLEIRTCREEGKCQLALLRLGLPGVTVTGGREGNEERAEGKKKERKISGRDCQRRVRNVRFKVKRSGKSADERFPIVPVSLFQSVQYVTSGSDFFCVWIRLKVT